MENLLLSSRITNETEIIFILYVGLNDIKESLINSRLHKTLVVIHVNEIKNWDIIKGNSERANLHCWMIRETISNYKRRR